MTNPQIAVAKAPGLPSWASLSKWSPPQLMAGFVVIQLVLWTGYCALSTDNLDLYGDMAENYAWGLHPWLGYYKHPPLFAWIVAAWFHVWPSQDWAYYLLSMTNAAVGLVAIWWLAGHFVADRVRLACAILLFLTPFYQFLGSKYDANTALLSLWPLTAFLFYRALMRPTWLRGLGLGLIMAAAMLAKYYSALLILTLVAVALTHPRRNAFLVSPAPWIATVVAIALFTPHVLWAVEAPASPFSYAGGYVGSDLADVAARAVQFSSGQIGYLLPMLAVMALALRRDWVGLGSVFRAAFSPERRAIMLIAFGPCLLTLLSSILLRAHLSAVWGLAIWFALPLALLTAPTLRPSPIAVDRMIATVFGFAILFPFSAPIVYAASWLTGSSMVVEPRRELALAVTRLWQTDTGLRLGIVGGANTVFERSISFYSPDHPSEFRDLDMRIAPWVTQQRIDAEGMALVCAKADAHCLSMTEPARALPGAQSHDFTVQRHSTWFGDGPAYDFVVVNVPPRP